MLHVLRSIYARTYVRDIALRANLVASLGLCPHTVRVRSFCKTLVFASGLSFTDVVGRFDSPSARLQLAFNSPRVLAASSSRIHPDTESAQERRRISPCQAREFCQRKNEIRTRERRLKCRKLRARARERERQELSTRELVP